MATPAPHRILVVDDQPDVVQAICTLLRLLGHEPLGLTRGEGVLDAVASFHPTLIFLDIGLPNISGYELARALRDRGHTGRIVAITGWGTAVDRQRALDAGFDEHVVKPIDAAIVEQVIARAR